MKKKVIALVEVTAVFSLTLILLGVLGSSPIGAWQRRVANRAFLEYALMIAVPLFLLIASRRNLASYGISLQNLRYHLDVAGAAFIPVAIASVAFSFVDYRQWDGALILTAIQIGLLFVLAVLLKRKPTLGENNALVGFSYVGLVWGTASRATLGNAISALIFYVLFLGIGEELLFRGYIQSRLNIAFGRSFTFFGVRWGWGAVIAAALFGLMHVINVGGFVAQQWQLMPWWGFWTFCSGLVFAFVREKTSGIVAPAILHGLPQGIAYAFLGL